MRELKGRSLDQLPVRPEQMGQLVALIDREVISTTAAKEVFAEMLTTGEDPQAIVQRRGLQQITDAEALAPLVQQVIQANPDKVAQYRGGKTGLMGFFVGQVMRQTQGKANPQLVQQLLQEKLAE
ncbi:MAG: hypothetical protein KatS3mg050_1225 [Litorilinea sp.]|nr:MAG: hypothetical protein KatS3mg050_1225 [Litorilinea sp.]